MSCVESMLAESIMSCVESMLAESIMSCVESMLAESIMRIDETNTFVIFQTLVLNYKCFNTSPTHVN